MVSKCLEYFNCPTELGLYFEAPSPITVSLKDVIACQYPAGTIPTTLTLTITIAQHTNVTIVDDLCTCPNLPTNNTWHNKLNFYLNGNSTLTYRLGEHQGVPCQKACDQSCMVEKELHFILLGKHAVANAICACRGTGTSTYTFTTTQEHKAPHTTSSLIIKGALADQAKFKSNALIKVHKGCAAVCASQINKNLLLSPGARALSIPKLEIETDDVVCRHDATVSSINQEHLFYLQSRGVTAQQAQQDLVRAFLG